MQYELTRKDAVLMYDGFRGGVDGALEEGSLIITLVLLLPSPGESTQSPSSFSSHMGGDLVMVIGIERAEEEWGKGKREREEKENLRVIRQGKS